MKTKDPSHFASTGAKAINELRKLERRNSFDLQELAQQHERRPGRKKLSSRRLATRIKGLTTHLAPVTVSLSVKLLWDGSAAMWRSRSLGLLHLLEFCLGILLLVFLHSVVESKPGRDAAETAAANMILRGPSFALRPARMSGSFGQGGRVPRDLQVLVHKLKTIVLILYGEETSVKSQQRLTSRKQIHDTLGWICKVVGVTEIASMQQVAMLEKVEEVERIVGIQ